MPSKEILEQWHEDPSNWKYKTFYYNKKDKSIFLPKKWGWGWTVNFANPISILILLGIIILSIALGLYLS